MRSWSGCEPGPVEAERHRLTDDAADDPRRAAAAVLVTRGQLSAGRGVDAVREGTLGNGEMATPGHGGEVDRDLGRSVRCPVWPAREKERFGDPGFTVEHVYSVGKRQRPPGSPHRCWEWGRNRGPRGGMGQLLAEVVLAGVAKTRSSGTTANGTVMCSSAWSSACRAESNGAMTLTGWSVSSVSTMANWPPGPAVTAG